MFLQNIGNGDMIQKAAHSTLLAGYIGANLASTWFAVPNGQGISAPRTGSRPGDPCADLLFGFVMAQMLDVIHDRAREVGIPLYQQVEDGMITKCVTWVDDVALAVMDEAEDLVAAASQLLSIVMDVALEHGMRMSYGQGKKAVILEFRGREAKKHRQRCEAGHGDHVLVLSEHEGATQVPLVAHYKHLGGHIVRGGSAARDQNPRSSGPTKCAPP